MISKDESFASVLLVKDEWCFGSLSMCGSLALVLTHSIVGDCSDADVLKILDEDIAFSERKFKLYGGICKKTN